MTKEELDQQLCVLIDSIRSTRTLQREGAQEIERKRLEVCNEARKQLRERLAAIEQLYQTKFQLNREQWRSERIRLNTEIQKLVVEYANEHKDFDILNYLRNSDGSPAKGGEQ